MHGCVKNTCFRVTASYIWRIVFSPGGSHETEGRTLSEPMSALGQKRTFRWMLSLCSVIYEDQHLYIALDIAICYAYLFSNSVSVRVSVQRPDLWRIGRGVAEWLINGYSRARVIATATVQ